MAGIPLLIHEGMSMGELRKLAHAEDEAEEAGTHVMVPGLNGAPILKEREPGDSSR